MRPDEIAAAVRRAIHERVLPPGQFVNQDELARQFGVSRIPLREALRTLAGEGLITMRPGQGAIVAELNAAEVKELYGLRLLLEPPLAPDIIENVRRRDVSELGAIVTSLATLPPSSSAEWADLGYSFQRRFYELSGRRHAVRLVVQVLNLVEPYARMHAHLSGARPAIDENRRQLVEALSAGYADALVATVVRGIEHTRDTLVGEMTGYGTI